MTDVQIVEWPYAVTPKDDRGPSNAAVIEHVDAVIRQQIEAHERLRRDMDKLTAKVESNYTYFRERVEAISASAARIESLMQVQSNAPVNIDKVLFTPKIVLTVLGTVGGLLLAVSGIFWATTYSIRSGQDELKSAFAVRAAKDDARFDLQDLRDKVRSDEASENRRQTQLLQLQLGEVVKALQAKGK